MILRLSNSTVYLQISCSKCCSYNFYRRSVYRINMPLQCYWCLLTVFCTLSRGICRSWISVAMSGLIRDMLDGTSTSTREMLTSVWRWKSKQVRNHTQWNKQVDVLLIYIYMLVVVPLCSITLARFWSLIL